jgi:hypothetical protein
MKWLEEYVIIYFYKYEFKSLDQITNFSSHTCICFNYLNYFICFEIDIINLTIISRVDKKVDNVGKIVFQFY